MRLAKKRLGPGAIVAGAVTLGLAFAGVLVVGPASASSPALAKVVSFTNPLATAVTTDPDIASVDVEYGPATITTTAHLQNLTDPDYTLEVAYSRLPTIDLSETANDTIAVLTAQASSGAVTYNALGIGDGAFSLLPASSVKLTRNVAADTVTLSADSSLIAWSGPVYVVVGLTDQDQPNADGEGGDLTLFAADSSDPDTGVVGFGPVAHGSASTKTSLRLSWPVQLPQGAPIVATATVTPAEAGTVKFFDGKKLLGSASLHGGVASLDLPRLHAGGRHSIHAVFVPTTGSLYLGSTSSAVALRTTLTTHTKLKLSRSKQTYGAKPVTATVAVSSKAKGEVVLRDGKKKLKTLKLKKGKATYTLSKKLKKGVHKLVAKFVPAPHSAFAASTSKTVKLKVIKH